MKKSIQSLLMAVLMMCACTSEDLTQPQTPSGKGIPFTATISGKAATRAIKENTTDGILETSWAKGEKVALIYTGSNSNTVVDVMEVTEVGSDGSATISGTITGSPADGDKVNLFYPASVVDVSGGSPVVKAPEQLLAVQDGKLDSIAKKYDYRMKDGAKLKVVLGSASLDGTVSLENQLAIVRFSLVKQTSNGTSALEAESFEIDDNSGQPIITVKPETADSVLYVAMPPATAQAFHFIAKKGNEEYFYSQPSATLAAGKYYYQNMTLKDMLNTPLTLEATEEGTTVTVNTHDIKYQYAINGGSKTNVDSEETPSVTIELKAGEFVEFYSTNSELSSNITPNKKTYVYGNVMSLIDDSGQGFANDKTIGHNALKTLFRGATELDFHPKKRIVLPATTLDAECYENMFNGCTGLTELPADLLPAGKDGNGSLANNCYKYMFKGCTGLKTLPANLLPATTLVFNCYESMFEGCTGLTELPADLLPAGKDGKGSLANNCYKYMFNGCTSLAKLPADLLPATTLIGGCYSYMFNGCTGLTELPANLLPATTLESYCYQYMFNGCTGLKTLPANLLPATTLADYCYQYMFDGCKGLTELPAGLLPAGKDGNGSLASYCYWFMFNGCTGLETLPENLLPATTLANGCYKQMFKGCTSLQNSPKLPAVNITSQYCYDSMFYGCTSLNEAWVKAAFNDNCSSMFKGCTATGAVLHTQSANVAGWNGAGADYMGSFTADDGWTD